jgi:hypothetical protein
LSNLHTGNRSGYGKIRTTVRIRILRTARRPIRIQDSAKPYNNNKYYYMAFQNSLFWLVDKRSVKTHIRTVVGIFRIWTGIPDVVYLAGNFCFANRKKFCFLIFQLCVIKIYKQKFQTTKLFLIEHACLPYIFTQWNWR